LKKFFTLWFLSLLPIFFSFFILPENQSQTLLGQFRAAFTPAEQFVYAVSFLSPTLYLLWERHQQREKFIQAGKKSTDLLAIVPRGFGIVLLLTLVVFIFTAFAFGAAKAWDISSPTAFQRRVGTFAVNSAVWVYLYGVYCWYLTIVMSVDAEAQDFELVFRAQEDAVTTGLRKRLESKGEANAE
jgi:hypothetical protein